MSVMLAFSLALSSLGYKQVVLSSGATESQYAFYAADSALECALYYDQRFNLFAFPASDPGTVPAMTCGGLSPVSATESWFPSYWVVTGRFVLDSTHCADVTVYKYSAPQPPNNTTTYIFSQGYDVSCTAVGATGARYVSRGMGIHY